MAAGDCYSWCARVVCQSIIESRIAVNCKDSCCKLLAVGPWPATGLPGSMPSPAAAAAAAVLPLLLAVSLTLAPGSALAGVGSIEAPCSACKAVARELQLRLDKEPVREGEHADVHQLWCCTHVHAAAGAVQCCAVQQLQQVQRSLPSREGEDAAIEHACACKRVPAQLVCSVARTCCRLPNITHGPGNLSMHPMDPHPASTV